MYNYQTERPRLFTEQGQLVFLSIMNAVRNLLKTQHVIMMDTILRESQTMGDSWLQLACVDRLVELGEIVEISGKDVIGQHRVFIKK